MTAPQSRQGSPLPVSRRDLLARASSGFGALALAALLESRAGAAASTAAGAATRSPLLPRPPHHQPKARSVIFLFMEGGVSQVDSFDHKPDLAKYHGKDPRKVIGKLEKTQFRNVGRVFRSPWEFAQRGESGIWASNLFPHIVGEGGHGGILDQVAVIRSMTSKFPEHTGANYFLHSGVGLQGRPSMGAWATYGLGSPNQELPGYIVLNGGQIPSGGLDNFSSGFLPAGYQGSLLHAIGTPLANVTPSESPELQGRKRDLVRELNAHSLRHSGRVDALESAISNYELAAKMQVAVPELMDVSGESAATRALYGLDAKNKHTRTYARQCLIARRLVERGVRFIELTIPMVFGYGRWDAHGNIKGNHGGNAVAVDQPIAGLITDLRRRGMLDDTLVIWSGEFGRTPFAQGSNGRDHNEHGFSLWLAGGGVRGGVTHGATDNWGYRATQDRLEMHDLHATVMHLLGIDHTRLTYRFGGRDIRLTDVYGDVIEDILA